MSDVQFIDSLVLTHEELLLVYLAVQMVSPSDNLIEGLEVALNANRVVRAMGKEKFEALQNKINAYHAALHIADPSLDEHNDN